MAKRCDTRICRKGHRPLWRILPSGTPAEPVPLKVPTLAEWDAERLSWSSNNRAGAFASTLKLPWSGYRQFTTGALTSASNFYWSSTPSTELIAHRLSFNTVNASVTTASRAFGCSIRLIIDGNFTQQEFNDSYLGQTITIHGLAYGYVYNPATDKIWLDRNMGATQIASSEIDTLSYGWLYQWGRRTDGHQIRTSDTISSISNTPQPSHDDFIITFNNWLTPSDDNLWQGVNGINNPAN